MICMSKSVWIFLLCTEHIVLRFCDPPLFSLLRIEYDAYRTDLEELNHGIVGPHSLPKIEQSKLLFQTYKEKYEQMRNDVVIKLKFLEEHKVNLFFNFWDLSGKFKMRSPGQRRLHRKIWWFFYSLLWDSQERIPITINDESLKVHKVYFPFRPKRYHQFHYPHFYTWQLAKKYLIFKYGLGSNYFLKFDYAKLYSKLYLKILMVVTAYVMDQCRFGERKAFFPVTANWRMASSLICKHALI